MVLVTERKHLSLVEFLTIVALFFFFFLRNGKCVGKRLRNLELTWKELGNV